MERLQPLTSSVLAHPDIQHGFFTRQGGVSSHPWDTLNVGFLKDDPAVCVLENYRRIAEWFGREASELLVVKQVHGTDVCWVTSLDWSLQSAPDADAIVTSRPGLIIGVKTADCAPVLLMDPQLPMIAAAHAGWRGATGGVLEQTLQVMESHGACRAQIRAAIGPCIQQLSYEVGHEFLAIPGCRPFLMSSDTGRWLFDLPGFIRHRLKAAGIQMIETLSEDTASNPARFFSCRRASQQQERGFGVQFSGICIR